MPRRPLRVELSSSSSTSSCSSSDESDSSSSDEEERVITLVEAPILSMNQRSLEKHLSERVLHQEAATNAFATMLYRATRPRPEGEVSVRVVSTLLSGVSGTGKTMLCEEAQKLMLTGKGQQYEKQYITRPLGGLEEVGMSMFSGCGAGWEGYGAPSMAEKLKEACEDVGGLPPPYIVLQFDELDKADRKVMDALNSLLDRGTMELISEMEQVRPHPSTTLIVLFTANYAADVIDPLDSMASREEITRGMRAGGLHDCDIGRISWIIPFRAFTPEEMSHIFTTVHERLVTEHQLSITHGPLEMNVEAVSHLRDSVMQYYDRRLGVRGAMHLYKRELESFLDYALMALEDGVGGGPLTCIHRSLPIVEGDPFIERVVAEHYGNRERLRSSVERGRHSLEILVMLSGEAMLSTFILLPERPPKGREETMKKQRT
jgi:ATP-dependent Clp protease ATP-binding subunit ClpA